MGFEAGSGIPKNPRPGFGTKPKKEKALVCPLCGNDILMDFVEIALKDKDGNPARVHADCAKRSSIFLPK